MYLIESKRDGEWIYDPGMTMALQEYVKDYIFLDDDVLFPYMMHPVVQIGKFQNAFEEINQPYMDKHNIKMIRRESGGGAIYLDDRNMSFCFLFNGENDIFGNYARLFEPAVKALEKLGVDNVEHKGRNDLVLNGKKIAGAAMTMQSNRVYAGYSLLLDPDYEAMVHALNPNQKKIESHGIQSVRSRVGAIRDHLAPDYQDMSVWEFTDFMMCELLGVNDIKDAKRYALTSEDWAGVEKIAAEKYHNWDWNYGRFNQFEYRLTERFPIGTISVGLGVEHGKISAIQISGDFFGTSNLNDIEEALVGVRLRREDILKALASLDLTRYFGNLTKEEFTSFILSEKT